LVSVDDGYHLPTTVWSQLLDDSYATLDMRYQTRVVINVADYDSVQEALDAAPAGAAVVFPPATYAVPTGGFVLKSNGLLIDAMGATFTVAAWGTPAFLCLRSNSGANDHTFRIGLVQYTGTRGTHTGTSIRGSAPYCSGCAVWSNGDRNYIEYVRTIGMPTPIFFASWDGTSASDRTGIGNRIGYLEAEGYDFGVLYVKQSGYDWGDGYLHDDIDDSSGANPTHAIYCSAASGQEAGTGSIGRWITERHYYGHPYLFKYADRLTFDQLIAYDTAGAVVINECDDVRGNAIVATAQRSGVTGTTAAVAWQWTVAPSKRNNITSITVQQISGVDAPAVNLWADDSVIGSISVEDNRTTANASAGAVQVRGTRTRVRSLTVRQVGAATKAALLGLGAADTTDCAVEDVVQPGEFLPVTVQAASVGCRWNRKNAEMMSGAAPTTGSWLRGDFVRNSAPSAGGTFGWVCTTSGTPGTWKVVATIAA
jgi:hypothetical protein